MLNVLQASPFGSSGIITEPITASKFVHGQILYDAFVHSAFSIVHYPNSEDTERAVRLCSYSGESMELVLTFRDNLRLRLCQRQLPRQTASEKSETVTIPGQEAVKYTH